MQYKSKEQLCGFVLTIPISRTTGDTGGLFLVLPSLQDQPVLEVQLQRSEDGATVNFSYLETCATEVEIL